MKTTFMSWFQKTLLWLTGGVSCVWGLFPLNLQAGQSGDFTYEINSASNAVTITSYAGMGGDVVMPDYINELPVTSLGDAVFKMNIMLKTIALPSHLTTIGKETFWYCANLQEIKLPNLVHSVGQSAFYNCNALTNLILGTNLENIEPSAFAYCYNLTSLSLPASLTNLSAWAFVGCARVTNIIVDAANPALTSQDGVLFNHDLSSLVLYPCGRSGGYVVPGSVKEIANGAFNACAGLTSITLPDGLTDLGTFSDCFGLTRIIIPSGVATLQEYAFKDCSSLTAILFKGNAPAVSGSHVFDGTPAVIYYLEGATGWGASFGGLPTVLWSEASPYRITSLGGTAAAISQYLGSETNVIVPGTINGQSIVSIADGAFANQQQLVQISLPGVITNLGAGAFASCTALTSLILPDSVGEIGARAFAGCASLQQIFLPKSLGQIGAEAFADCAALREMQIPNSVTNLGDQALRNCARLASVSIGNGATQIPAGFCADNAALTNVIIGRLATNISISAFMNCPLLTNVYFCGNAPSLEADAFGGSSVTLYHLPGTSGWSEMASGYAQEVWHPAYSEWAYAWDLDAKYPAASDESDDPDHDGLTNLQEMAAGTDPADANSRLVLELTARPSALSESDQTNIPDGQFALYFAATPGLSYDLVSSVEPGGPWTMVATNIPATTSQKRVVLSRPATNAFFRILVHSAE